MGTFRDAVDAAAGAVHASRPQAQLCRVVGTGSAGPATSAQDVDTLRATFLDGARAIAVAWSKGALGPPKPLGMPMGDAAFAWPVTLDLPDAVGLLRKAGLADPFTAVTLRQPLVAGARQPLYVFDLPAGPVAVGCGDRKVHMQ